MRLALRVLFALALLWTLSTGLGTTTKRVSVALAAVPPIPSPPSGAPSALHDLFQPLPAVAREGVDAASRRVLADYDTSHALDPSGLARMFTDAWHSLSIPPGAEAAVATLERDLVSDVGVGLTATPAQMKQIARDGTAALPLLARDPANGPRLNNAAVALYYLDFAAAFSHPSGPVDGIMPPALHQETGTRLSAFWLFQQAAASFPVTPELALNAASFTGKPSPAQLLAQHPDNIALRLLVAGLQLGPPASPASRNRAAKLLAPLVATPETWPLGHAALGDIDLQLANDISDAEHFTARSWARRALEEYDTAMSESSDPGLLNGRALALAFLGDLPDAIAAERLAAQRVPTSIDYEVELARLHAESGDIAGMQASARSALARANPSWDPLIADAHYQIDPCNTVYVPYLPTSFGSFGSIFPPLGGGCGAGGAYFVLNLIPKLDQFATVPEESGFSSQGRAIVVTMAAALITRNRSLASAAEREATTVHPALAAGGDDLNMVQTELLPALALALHPATAPHPEQFTAVENAERYAGRFRQAAALCSVIARRRESSEFSPSDALRCAGESLYLAAINQDHTLRARVRDDHAAAIDLRRSTTLNSPFEPAAPLEAAADAEAMLHQPAAAAADRRAARQIFASQDKPPGPSSQPTGVDVVAWQNLGDLDLQAGHDRQALSDYTTAVARIAAYDHATSAPPDNPQGGEAVAEEVTFNNLGLTRLALLQPAPDQPPTCAQNQATCLEAERDFRAALALDPDNPTFALNLGWVARLLKHEEDAKDFLRQAVAEDPTLYPAWNDLGVLAAEEGDTAAAREDWNHALQANPNYDLAEWNLGVLDMRAGIAGAFSAQQHLARAIERNPGLRNSEIEYRTDERVYRYVVGPDTGGGQALGRTLSIGTTALGWLTLLGLLFTAARSILTDKAAEKGAESVEERLPELWEKIAAWFRRYILGRKEEGESTPEEEPEQSGTAPPEREPDQRVPAVATAVEARPETEADEEETPGERSRWRRWEPWLVTIPALAIVTAILAHRANPGAQLAVGALTLLAAVFAVAVHEAGHLLAARLVRARITQQYWTAGVPIALVLAFIPLEMNLGPYIGHEIEGEVKEHHAWRVFAAGPAANIATAALCYVAFLAQPLPLLRLMAQAQLAVCAYSLLPVEQLDGKKLEKRPKAVFALGLLITAAGLAFLLGVL